MAQHPVNCWAGCGEDFVAEGPTHGSDEIVDGVPVQCPNCQEKYKLTVDGDGEADLQSLDPDQLGENITGHDSDRSTHF